MFALPQRADLRALGARPGARRASASPTRAGIKGYFWNSIKMVVPAVLISTLLGALNGYVLTKWRFPGHKLVFGMMLFACFIPFQSVIIPMAVILGTLGSLGNQLIDLTGFSFGFGNPTVNLVHRPCRLWPRLHDAVLPQLLRGVPDRARQGGDDRRRRLLPDLPPHPAAEFHADLHRHRDLPVHQHLERLSVRLDLRRRRPVADDGRAQQSRQHLDRASSNTTSTWRRRSSPPRRPCSSISSPAATSCAA